MFHNAAVDAAFEQNEDHDTVLAHACAKSGLKVLTFGDVYELLPLSERFDPDILCERAGNFPHESSKKLETGSLPMRAEIGPTLLVRAWVHDKGDRLPLPLCRNHA